MTSLRFAILSKQSKFPLQLTNYAHLTKHTYVTKSKYPSKTNVLTDPQDSGKHFDPSGARQHFVENFLKNLDNYFLKKNVPPGCVEFFLVLFEAEEVNALIKEFCVYGDPVAFHDREAQAWSCAYYFLRMESKKCIH